MHFKDASLKQRHTTWNPRERLGYDSVCHHLEIVFFPAAKFNILWWVVDVDVLWT